MKSVREGISKGDPFNVAIKQFPETFSSLYISMVRAGEEGGSLMDTLKTISTQLERSSSLRKKIKGAMMYPAIVVSIMIILGVLMMMFVVPTLTTTFVKLGIDLPLSTRLIIGTSDFLVHNILITIVGVIVAGLLGVGFMKTPFGKRMLAYIVVHLPVIGTLVKQTNAAYTARTLSSLLASGVDVIGAIKITEDVLQNVYYKEVLREAAIKVEKGSPLSEAFLAHQNLYPVLVGEMILVGEETGQISQMLGELANFYETEVEQKTKDLSTIIEPILMVTIGGGVGFFALAMISPIYSISDSIK
jgi:type IV pilus assembly protein PilC